MQPNRFQNGKIYKIISPNTHLIYIGSTTVPTLARRMAEHRCGYRRWKEGNKGYVASFQILEAGDAEIVLLESFPCNSKDELHAQENKHIQENQEIIVNKRKAPLGISKNEYWKQYGEAHAEEISIYQKHYREANSIKLAEYNKQYHQINAEKIAEQKKLYYQINAQKIAEKCKQYRAQKHTCECGGYYHNGKKARHERSRKHQQYFMSSQ